MHANVCVCVQYESTPKHALTTNPFLFHENLLSVSVALCSFNVCCKTGKKKHGFQDSFSEY